MGSYTKSPKEVLRTALKVGEETFSPYAHEYSPRTYTQPQLFACLVLKVFLNLDYRRLHGLLEDCPSLLEAIGMDRVPHFTTFQKASQRLIKLPRVKKCLEETVKSVGKKKESSAWQYRFDRI